MTQSITDSGHSVRIYPGQHRFSSSGQSRDLSDLSSALPMKQMDLRSDLVPFKRWKMIVEDCLMDKAL